MTCKEIEGLTILLWRLCNKFYLGQSNCIVSKVMKCSNTFEYLCIMTDNYRCKTA